MDTSDGERMTTIERSFLKYEKSGKRGVYAFWSKDWFSFAPWTHDNKYTPYVSKVKIERDYGIVNFYYIGPLSIVSYKVK